MNKGAEVLAELNDLPVDANDCPRQRVTVAACGPTDAQGNHETLEEATARLARREETPQQTAARLKAEATTAKQAVL